METLSILLIVLGFFTGTVFAQEKPRVIHTTDLSADPDDKQSMVRQLVSGQLVSANEFDIEGLIVSTGCWRKTQSNTDMLDALVDSKVVKNLSVHAESFPTYEYLMSISVMAVGEAVSVGRSRLGVAPCRRFTRSIETASHRTIPA